MSKRQEANRRYRAKNLEKERDRNRRYYEENREKELERQRKYRDENKDVVRARHRAHRNLPQPTRPAPSECECCGRVSQIALCLDHDHVTGAFRGWLCTACNRGIGSLGDDVTGLKCAINYLNKAVLCGP